MSERLTDEDLDELDSWGTSPNPSTTRLVVKEIRALRARVAKLEAALKDVRIDFEMWHEKTSIAKIDAALKDKP